MTRMGLEAATLSALRQRIAAIEAAGEVARPSAARLVAVDRGDVDAQLGGGLACGAMHEFYPAAAGDQAATDGFAALLAFACAPPGMPVVWIRQEQAMREGGELHADGLAALGIDPARLVLVRLRHAVSVLRAGIEVARSTAVGAALIEPWGSPKELDLTTQRRLVLAAEASGVTLFLLRPAAEPAPGSAETRWTVRAAPARALAMNAPGHPTFDLTLLRHRHGPSGGPWRLEWSRDESRFNPAPLWRDPLSLPRFRPAAPPAAGAVPRSAGNDAAPDRREGQGRDAHRRAGSGGA
ncbi:MAG: hypothetical protein J0H11_22560 [Rhizobiales bacterium]|nr:hypothetical protein [Hyphomicrobiales bacterium]